MSYDFAAAVKIARAHIPIEKAVSAEPGDFAIVDTGERFAVYMLRDFQRGRISGKLVATVNLSGEVASTMSAETLEIMGNTAAMNAIAKHKAGRTQFCTLDDITE